MGGGKNFVPVDDYNLNSELPVQHIEELEGSSNFSDQSEIGDPARCIMQNYISQGSPVDATVIDTSLPEGVQHTSYATVHNQPGVFAGREDDPAATDVQLASGEEDILYVPDARGDGQQPGSLLDAKNGNSVQVFEHGLDVATDCNMHAEKEKTRLYTLVQISSDKQDSSFVQKVMLSQPDIFKLCNQIAPNAAKPLGHENQQSQINFDLLNNSSVSSVGFYGNKNVMEEIFSKNGIMDEATLKLMREGKLEPGLHGVLHEGTLHIFYWHQGQSLSDASRKDISCNFIRYLVELCDIVHICLDATGLESLLLASKSNFSKKARTQRLKLFTEKASDNDLKVTPGFQVDLTDCINHSLPAGNGSSSEESAVSRRFQLAEGYHRAAFLVATVHPPKMSVQGDEKIVKVDEVPDLVKTWESKYNLDVSSLNDDDLILFLHSAQSVGHTELSEIIENSMQTKAKHMEKEAYHVDALVSEQEKLVSGIFRRGALAYLKVQFPWEEALVSEVESSNGEHSGSETGVSSREVDQNYSSYPYTDVVANVQGEGLNQAKTSNKFELELSAMCSGKLAKDPSGSDLLFVGSEVSFLSATNKQCNLNLDHGTFSRFTIHPAGDAKGVRLQVGPILYEKVYFMRPVKRISNCESSMTDVPIRISATMGSFEAGPVLISRPLILHLLRAYSFHRPKKSLQLEGIANHSPPSSEPMDTWMKAISDTTVCRFSKRVSLLNNCLANYKEKMETKGFLFEDLGLRLFIQAMLLNRFEKPFPYCTKPLTELDIDEIKKDWEDLNLTSKQSEPLEIMKISLAVRNACLELHKNNRRAFLSKITTVVFDDIVPKPREKVQAELKKEKEDIDNQVVKDVVNFTKKQRMSLSKKNDVPTLSVTSCRTNLQEKHESFMSFLTRLKQRLWPGGAVKGCSLTIGYNRPVADKEDISWKAIDLAPMKDDLERRSAKEAHVIIPQIPKPVNLLSLNSRETRLRKVVYLKSGQVLVFIEKFLGEGLLSIYVCPRLASVEMNRPIVELKKRVDVMSFDETSKFVALYTRQFATIQVCSFDDTFTHFNPTGIELKLTDYSGSEDIRWMRFVPEKRELVLIDALNSVRLFELSQAVMICPRRITLTHPFIKGCISADGSCLVVFHNVNKTNSSTDQVPGGKGKDSQVLSAPTAVEEADYGGDVRTEDLLVLEVYRLDAMYHLKSVHLDIPVSDIDNLEANVVLFGTQMHLLIHDSSRPQYIFSRVLKSSSASEVLQIKVNNNNHGILADAPSITEPSQKSCPELEYVYHIFDKYATSPALKTTDLEADNKLKWNLICNLLLKDTRFSPTDLGAKCIKCLKDGIEKLSTEKGKDFSQLDIRITAHALEDWLDGRGPLDTSSNMINDRRTPWGNWLQRLVCLVPLQIARAENNALKPLVDGLQISNHLNYADALALVEMIRFGFYEYVLASWVGDIKVVSSMGKQSSGKSYLLNHLSGSLLDVAGGRCTDGVWMTMRPTKSCLYVLLDFEGFGSFERSEQEDMLLSIFNAAVSNITIFNKKDFHLDKETEAVFDRFQSGVSLVKEDGKLFRGLFYMAIKDVDNSDVEDLKVEFQGKISQICSKSRQNFLMKMYGGEIEIAAMPPFQKPEYHDSVNELARTLQDLPSVHQNGRSFNRDLKIVLAQICTKDWSPIDSKRVQYKLVLLYKHWETAISSGRLAEGEAETVLMNFDTRETISEFSPLKVGDAVYQVNDTNVQLAPRENQVIGAILKTLRTNFEQVFPRLGEQDEVWHASFDNFLAALADRRKRRALEWLDVNTVDFEKDGDVENLRLRTLAVLAEVKQKLSLCSCKCHRCFLRCLLERSHPGDHSCQGTHRCTQKCAYCSDDRGMGGEVVNGCDDVAGHEGTHDCRKKSHTCSAECTYFGKASNCNKLCILKARHEGDHKCNSRQHMCQTKCSLRWCTNICVIPYELGSNHRHACHEKMCPEECIMQGCSRFCSSQDHFHSQSSLGSRHFCGNEHQCYKQCEASGNCEVSTEVLKKTRMFEGERASFEYDHVSEQNGKRKACCIPIPAFKEEHRGPHSHTTNKNAVHFCETRCEACGYFCDLPINHTGLHNTTHGNMKHVNFVSEEKNIDILDRKYSWGESGLAEMCMMHCKNRGRGHIHLIPCLKGFALPWSLATKRKRECAAKVIEGARHETREYGPDFGKPKDELTHAAFWKHMRFQDPSSDEDQQNFALCNNHCSLEHAGHDGRPDSVSASKFGKYGSFCVETMWHSPVSTAENQNAGLQGYISADGHRFLCEHSKNVAYHVIFIIDRSASMDSSDCRPSLVKFTKGHDNRLGCVYEAILRFIKTRTQSTLQDRVSIVLFNHSATVAIEGRHIGEKIVNQLLTYSSSGGTNYSVGLEEATSVLNRSLKDPHIQEMTPVVIFLSDGGDQGRVRRDTIAWVREMTEAHCKLAFHTIKFGSDPCNQILMDMANAGNGSFQVSLDEVQLAKSFEVLATSLRTTVASLM